MTSVRFDSNYTCENIGKLTIVSALSIQEDKLTDLVSNLKDGHVLVMDDIDKRLGSMLWQKLIKNERATISFDLYYMGIVLNVDKRYKHDYIVNF